ncbi:MULTISPECIES: flagellar motor protein MotB [unclassified Clostridium]|uniref:OmpA/MotB family protein n=1 Tax=unclassified Clostridium TaxID=2614128 RepID=UPI0013F0D445|nr:MULTISPECIES: flagellar motor protein MotB [unclassified Clostridium]NFG61266.1 chemotaxis protein MotB [Clostridium botulinum]NFQ09263.1 chemotaxis protein MotB [Clostridium botulinum]
MKKKKEHHEEHVDETWLIPYADMLTLLLALFIVMFAMSKVDNQKLQQASEQFSVIFSGTNSAMKGGNPAMSTEEASISESNNSTIEDGKMNEVKQMLEKEISQQGYSDKVKVDLNEGGLEVSIQDVILFNSGDADVLKNVHPLLLKISGMLQGLDNDIKIVGHTDNVPINNTNFRSNWDLSAIRAINVMNFMVGSGGIKQEKISIQAYGDQKPKFDNSTDEGKAKNRRVEIFVGRKYPAEKK